MFSEREEREEREGSQWGCELVRVEKGVLRILRSCPLEGMPAIQTT